MKTRVTISLDVDFTGDVLEEYLQQLNDHEDSLAQRRWFALDYLISEADMGRMHPDARADVEFIELGDEEL